METEISVALWERLHVYLQAKVAVRKTRLVHGQRVDLSFQHHHSALVDDRAYIRHDAVAKDVVDEVVIALEPRRRYVLHRETIIRV